MDIQALVKKFSNKELTEMHNAIVGESRQRIQSVGTFKFKQTMWIDTTETSEDGNPETYDVNFIIDGKLHAYRDSNGIDPVDVSAESLIQIMQYIPRIV